ncbi:MAG: acyl carrier protein [Azospirillaceae bacterium]
MSSDSPTATADTVPTPAAIRAALAERVAGVLTIPVEELDESLVLVDDYGLTSVDLIDLVAGLQARYGIAFDPATLKAISCRSLADAVIAALHGDPEPGSGAGAGR